MAPAGGSGRPSPGQKSGQETGVARRKKPLVRPIRPLEIRPNEGKASRLGLARSCSVPERSRPQQHFRSAPRPPPNPELSPSARLRTFQASPEPPPGCQFLLLSAKELCDRPPPDQKASPGTFPGRPPTTTPVMLRERVAVQPCRQRLLDYISRHAKGVAVNLIKNRYPPLSLHPIG